MLAVPPLRAQPCNIADIAAVGGTTESPGDPDLQHTLDDIIVFVGFYNDSTGCPGDPPCNLADLTGIGGPPATADGQLSFDDVIAFTNAFSAGCPTVVTGEDAAVTLYETEFEGVYVSGQVTFVLTSGRQSFEIHDTQAEAKITVGAWVIGTPVAIVPDSSPWPEGVTAQWESLAVTLVSEHGIYYAAGRSLRLTKEELGTIDLFIPVSLFATSTEAAVFASGTGPISTPLDVINDNYNNQPPRPPGPPPIPGNYHYTSGTARPVCPSSLSCADLCECKFRQSLWDAQMALHADWAQCSGIYTAAIFGCMPVSGLGWWGGPAGIAAAYTACVAAAVHAEITCKDRARADYAIAYQTALSEYEECMAGCGGGGGGGAAP